MPLYEYRCTACGHIFEKIQSFSAPEHSECPKCQSRSERLLSAPAIQFKGSGFYLTDYGKTGGGSKAGAKSEGGSPESKPSSGSGESKASPAPASAPSSPSSSAASTSSGSTSSSS